MTLDAGLVSGLVASVVMAFFMSPFRDDDINLVSTIITRFVRLPQSDRKLVYGATFLQLLYGTLAGGLLGLVLEEASINIALIAGIIYSLLLWSIADFFWGYVAGIFPENMRDRRRVLLRVGLHLSYGLTLGVLLQFLRP